VLLVAHQCDSA